MLTLNVGGQQPPLPSSAVGLRVRRPLRAVAVMLLAVGATALTLAARPNAFLAAHSANACPRGWRAARGAAAPPEKQSGADGYEKYSWQRVAEGAPAQGRGGASAAVAADVDFSSLPDLPDFEDEEDKEAAMINTLPAMTRVREVTLPELPGDDDQLLPPPPNPVTDGGLGLFEWTGVWILSLAVVVVVAAVGSYALGQIRMDKDLAATISIAGRLIFGFFQLMFTARIAMTQFPKLDVQELPWAIFYYPTEWVLSPTRQIFPPEAGVDVAPVIWLMLDLLFQELLVGKDGVLTMAAQVAPPVAGFIR